MNYNDVVKFILTKRHDRTLFKELKSILKKNRQVKPLVRAQVYRAFDVKNDPHSELENIKDNELLSILEYCDMYPLKSSQLTRVVTELISIVKKDNDLSSIELKPQNLVKDSNNSNQLANTYNNRQSNNKPMIVSEIEPKVSSYYIRIIDLILRLYRSDLENSVPGHCMKITGLGVNELEYLWDLIQEQYPKLDTYIISEGDNSSHKFISATKLVEFRNKQENPLLILIPSNSRTAAEDSYGNATFKEISLEGIEQELKKELVRNIPSQFSYIIKSDILKYLSTSELSESAIIKYLLKLEEVGYSEASIGNNIHLLSLIPDEILIKNQEKIRSRLNFNLESVALISSFNKPLYDRISELPLESNSIQKDLVSFIKNEKEARNGEEICALIYNQQKNLNFSNWKIPELNYSHTKLVAEEIKSSSLKVEEGRMVIEAEENKAAKVKIRFSTNPNPKDISDLKYFKIILMSVNGGAGEEVTVLRKLKNSSSNRPYREASIELNSNMIEEGSYFFKVLAEDEHGNILNANDDFREDKIQKAWDADTNENKLKTTYDFKLSCDTDDFDYFIQEAVERDENQRKDKLNNVLQAYFKYRITKIKTEEEIDIPSADESSNIWLNDNTKLTSIFHINYSKKDNYQISLSSKLKRIEDEFLNNKDAFGFVKVSLKNNAVETQFSNISFVQSELSEVIPKSLIKLRKEVFTAIQESNENNDGVFETADIFNHYELIKKYIKKLNDWITGLKKLVADKDSNFEQNEQIKNILSEVQFLDTTKIKTKLPDGKASEAILLSPLHPLRLAWTIQLIEVFNEWEQQTIEYPSHKEEWSKNLESFFEGQLPPENNPLVLVEPLSLNTFNYSGELAYGWGLYLNVIKAEVNHGMTSVSRQMKHYYRNLFNISKDNFVETDISQKLVIRHLKNYLSQHPYADKLIINLFNSGDAYVFANAFVELEKEKSFSCINYEVRIFKGVDKIIEHGEALKNLINPEFNISEEAEIFSQPSSNRLFPKLRFSINNISDYLQTPSKYNAHLSFLISPFPLTVELIKAHKDDRNFYLNGVLTESTVRVNEEDSQIKWNRFIRPNELPIKYDGSGKIGVSLFDNFQYFIAGALKLGTTDKIPSTSLELNSKDQVLLTHLHDYSDWVVTFDKNLGPQIFDQPTKEGKIPFLLDYVPGEEISGISSYLTTKPTSEILGLLGPHFAEFDLDIYKEEDEKKVKSLLEDLRAVSSSLVLQLNSTKNKAFEVIGSAFTKRVLEKKGLLSESFLIPIDLHQNLFENLQSESKSRADNLLVGINTVKKEINISVIEIKCRKSLGNSESDELKNKMCEQIENTIEALRMHFDPEYDISADRLDREIKNKELKSLLSFYIERAHRYNYLSENAYESYISFLQYLDKGFKIKFKQLGLIFNFSAKEKHLKEVHDNNLTFFTFGGKLISEILDPDSDLNTRRLESNNLEQELTEVLGNKSKLKPFIQEFKTKEKDPIKVVTKTPTAYSETTIPLNIASETIQEVKNKSIVQTTSSDVVVDNSAIQQENSTPTPETVSDETILEDTVTTTIQTEHNTPEYDILIGKSSPSDQFGLLGESRNGKKVAIDLSETNTISLFGVQGGGKSYTIGTISEMVLKQFDKINQLPAPLAGVIFHYSESMDYEPEFTSMIYPNNNEGELAKLKDRYGAEPDNIEDVIILTPKDKLEERQAEYPSINVVPIAFNSKELSVQDWMFILGAMGNDSAYIKQLKAIMKQHRRNITIDGITESVEASELLSNSQKALARQKLSFAREYIDDDFMLRDSLKPGRLIIVDLRDEFIVKDEALGLFVIMLNIFSAVKNIDGNHFNKFIVFDEAHKYMDNKELTGNIVTSIREMRHKGVSIMIASQDPPSLPNEIIELSSIVLLHKFNSPQWLKHIQKSITQLASLGAADMSSLTPGEGFLWSTKATDKAITAKPMKISTRPRVTQHGGGTIQATGEK